MNLTPIFLSLAVALCCPYAGVAVVFHYDPATDQYVVQSLVGCMAVYIICHILYPVRIKYADIRIVAFCDPALFR